MTLDEIARQARADMIPINSRISELRRLAKETTSMGDRARIYQRIRRLDTILADMSEVAYTLEHYYKRRNEHDISEF